MKRILKTYTIILFLLIVGMVYCYFNYQYWTHLKTDNFEALTEYRGENIKGFRGAQILIHINFKPFIIKIDQYAKKNNVVLIVNQSYRNSDYPLNRTVVEPVKLSNHLAGFAIDFNVKYNGTKYFSNDLKLKNLNELPESIQSFINDIRKDKDLRWGGDFRKEDPIHIDNPINLKSKKDWIEFSRLCNLDYSNGVPKWKIWKAN